MEENINHINNRTTDLSIKKVSELFDNPLITEPLFDINLNNIKLGMTEFQIKNFVLNKKEFTNPLFIFHQTKLELFNRIQSIHDLYYQYKTFKAKIKLAEGRIEELKTKRDISNEKIREAKIELQELEIEKSNIAIINIKKQAQEKLNETLIFYEIFKEYELLDCATTEELKRLEEEGWKIKSAYYPELLERYGLTPKGFLSLPHENGGLKVLIEIQDNIKEINNSNNK